MTPKTREQVYKDSLEKIATYIRDWGQSKRTLRENVILDIVEQALLQGKDECPEVEETCSFECTKCKWENDKCLTKKFEPKDGTGLKTPEKCEMINLLDMYYFKENDSDFRLGEKINELVDVVNKLSGKDI